MLLLVIVISERDDSFDVEVNILDLKSRFNVSCYVDDASADARVTLLLALRLFVVVKVLLSPVLDLLLEPKIDVFFFNL